MMKRIKNTVNVYEVGNGFMVDIVTFDDEYEAWIYHNHYGVKSLMWGAPKHQQTFGEFKTLVEANVPEYANDYRDEYMD